MKAPCVWVWVNRCAALFSVSKVQLSQDGVGEYYTSGVIKAMLDDPSGGHQFEAILLQKHDMQVRRWSRSRARWPCPFKTRK